MMKNEKGERSNKKYGDTDDRNGRNDRFFRGLGIGLLLGRSQIEQPDNHPSDFTDKNCRRNGRKFSSNKLFFLFAKF